MVRYSKPSIALAVSLSALAGYIDAHGFLEIGSFVSFMSGNSTRLGIVLRQGNTAQIAVLSGIIATFVVGVVLGTLLGHFAGSRRSSIVLSSVTLLLTVAAMAQHYEWRLVEYAAIVLAMGAENAVFQRRGEVSIGLTYMTGTLVRMGQRIAGAFLGGSTRDWMPYALLWLGMLCGAVIGTTVGAYGLWFAALYAGCLATISVVVPPQRPQRMTRRRQRR